MSRERPIIFSAPMIKAILANRKTQTRRIVKFNDAGRVRLGKRNWHVDDPAVTTACPYGQPGDRLWVRENWRPLMDHLSECTGPEDIRFAASVSEAEWAISKWRPSIHMPRWASRITLAVTDVRVQRLNSISEADAIAEGCPAVPLHSLDCASTAPSEHFRRLWESIHGPGSWDANPWVWAVSFERVVAKARSEAA
jgi:hypothetical protein